MRIYVHSFETTLWDNPDRGHRKPPWPWWNCRAEPKNPSALP